MNLQLYKSLTDEYRLREGSFSGHCVDSAWENNMRKTAGADIIENFNWMERLRVIKDIER